MRIRPQVADALIAVALTCVSAVLGKESGSQGWDPLDAWGYLLVVLAGLPLAFRVRAPLAVLLWTHLVFLVYVASGYWPVVTTFGPLLSLYTVASLCALRTAVGCGVLMAGVWIYAGAVSPRGSMASVVTQALGFALVLIRFGVLARRSAELARQLRREQAERARREVAAERGRIARELHDVVAHHMSVISVQAGLAGFVFASDPPTARAALSTISGASAEALDELRRMLQVLREAEDGAAPVAPMPGLDRIGELADRIRAGGIPVTLRTLGTPRPLAPGVELCAYRVVQEALTNVLKHAGKTRAEVQLRYERHQLMVSVTNEGDGGEREGVISDRLRAGGGHGLIGMRERAKLYGGSISVGPRSGGGFAVTLTLPTSAGAVQGEEDASG
ncbi:sensor histidine kinase [Streptomyces sp. NPDC001691]|uniref:sensor histidine kinase n=1 Tax=unclassified Streptomyces TaxID=2593676 RepID=UPI000DEBB62B|nr:sensor histidine kinase [Streptomyces sp. SDr-06]RCH68080.1 sensor histidine kinase [Streptomyces sp. SDr-06]